MKRLLLLCLTYIMCVGNHQMAAQDSSESPGIFNSLAVGVSASTTGIGIGCSQSYRKLLGCTCRSFFYAELYLFYRCGCRY